MKKRKKTWKTVPKVHFGHFGHLGPTTISTATTCFSCISPCRTLFLRRKNPRSSIFIFFSRPRRRRPSAAGKPAANKPPRSREKNENGWTRIFSAQKQRSTRWNARKTRRCAWKTKKQWKKKWTLLCPVYKLSGILSLRGQKTKMNPEFREVLKWPGGSQL